MQGEASKTGDSDRLETRIEEWRSYVQRRQAIAPVDVDELEDHLRGQVSTLEGAGLSADEAFLVAVKRLGALDALSHEFAREHSERLWKQLILSSAPAEGSRSGRREMFVAFALAVAAGIAVKIPEMFGRGLMAGVPGDEAFYARNMSLFVFPILAGYFAWKREILTGLRVRLAATFAIGAVLANIYPFETLGSTEILTVLHLPMALWLAIGVAYAGGRWSEYGRRMDFVRYSGELFIYYVLIALGGGVLTAFTVGMFAAIGVDMEPLIGSWILPCGALGAVIIGSWLVEAKQGVIENMAPVLTKVFTPLFAVSLVAFLATMAWTGQGIDVEREVLIAFDLLLALVVGLLLYSISARDREAPPGIFDVVSIVLVVSALIADAFALAAIAQRISDFGFSPNRVAALGENIILLVNLAWSGVLYVRFLRGRGAFDSLERWQMSYLTVYAVWTAVVVAVFPPVFGFL